MGDLLTLALAAAAIFVLAALAQAVSGFGSALLAIPLLVMVMDPVPAVVTATGVSLVISGTAWRRERAHVMVPVGRRLVLAGVLGMPLGLATLLLVSERALGIGIGILVLVTVAALACRVKVPDSPGMHWVAGMMSGALLTSTGMNGPPLVLAVHGVGGSARSTRATLQTVFTVQDLLALCAFALAGLFSQQVVIAMAAGCLGIPLGWAIGDRIFHRLSEQTFRRVILVGLSLAAVTSLVQTTTH
ncbi:hypothetical protein BJ980_002864 [Nocardioides daedukensis]|uniref:Probable membrane transporter protein n=1 Tax=Nocardioides daedukensis TaxID=634462 RepID=A0A7Y9S283_9ACTN|nr:sulfite exporter TauE/SafE family protein [Nocardioides daedukensis]NYG59941.1 hypothetical protein [Nocardioides daedukensis]